MESKLNNTSTIQLEELFLNECKQLINQVSCDFTGVALQKKQALDIIWPYAVGNRNEKYQYITVRYGKGIAGKVIASGSSLKVDSFPHNIFGKSTDYPIMLAEKLISAYAYPLQWKGIPKGALLIGYRSNRVFTSNDMELVKQIAQKVEKLLPLYFE